MDGYDRPLQKYYEGEKMKCKILRVDFGQRAKDLYYMIKYELKPDREYKRREQRLARAIAYNNFKYR